MRFAAETTNWTVCLFSIHYRRRLRLEKHNFRANVYLGSAMHAFASDSRHESHDRRSGIGCSDHPKDPKAPSTFWISHVETIKMRSIHRSSFAIKPESDIKVDEML